MSKIVFLSLHSPGIFLTYKFVCVLKMINRSNFTINIFFFISYIISLVYWQRKSWDGFTLHHAYGIFFTKDLFVLLWWIMCQILDQHQQTNEKIVVFSRDIAALKLIKRDFSTSSLFFGMKKGISIFSKMFSLVVTLFQKYRKSTEYIHIT